MSNINEIAKLANVSKSTVSRVLNNHPYVSQISKEAVLNAINELNYVPNANAINLSKGRTSIIGFLTPRFNHPFFNKLIETITNECKKRGCHILICQYENIEEERVFYRMLRNKQIDGIILGSSSSSRAYLEGISEYGPVVSCEKLESSNISSVYIEHSEGITLALNHIFNKGYRKPGFCTESLHGIVGKHRYNAYEKFMEIQKIPFGKEWIFSDQFTMQDGINIVNAICQQESSTRPDSLVVGSDLIAAGIIFRSNQLGIKIPVVGFDNQPISETFGITTINQPIIKLGMVATELLFEKIYNKNSYIINKKLDVELLVRNST